MNLDFSDLKKEDILKYIEDIKETSFLIQTQLNDALDTYKEVKGERQKNLIKKIILETDNEITTSNGFLIFYQLCKGKLFKAKDEELNEYLSKKFAAYNNVDIKKWFEILEYIELPSTKMLLRAQSILEKIDDTSATLRVSSNWLNMVISRKNVIKKAFEKFIGHDLEIYIEPIDSIYIKTITDKDLKQLFDQNHNLSLLKPWKGGIIERREYRPPSLPWFIPNQESFIPTPISKELATETFFYNESEKEFSQSSNSEEGISEIKFLNFPEIRALNELIYEPENNSTIIAFLQLQLGKVIGKEYPYKNNDIKVPNDFNKILEEKVKEIFSKKINKVKSSLPKHVKYDDSLWGKLFSEASELRRIIWEFRLSSQEKIAKYLGDEREILFEDIYKFLTKNELNLITVPTIEKLGEFDGGYYLVKKISQTFQGIKNIRGPYKKWVSKKIEDEENDENIDKEFGLSFDHWQMMFEEFKHYSKYYQDKETGDKMTLRSYSPRLSKWVQIQRHNYKKGRLSKERIKALESLKNWHFKKWDFY